MCKKTVCLAQFSPQPIHFVLSGCRFQLQPPRLGSASRFTSAGWHCSVRVFRRRAKVLRERFRREPQRACGMRSSTRPAFRHASGLFLQESGRQYGTDCVSATGPQRQPLWRSRTSGKHPQSPLHETVPVAARGFPHRGSAS